MNTSQLRNMDQVSLGGRLFSLPPPSLFLILFYFFVFYLSVCFSFFFSSFFSSSVFLFFFFGWPTFPRLRGHVVTMAAQNPWHFTGSWSKWELKALSVRPAAVRPFELNASSPDIRPRDKLTAVIWTPSSQVGAISLEPLTSSDLLRIGSLSLWPFCYTWVTVIFARCAKYADDRTVIIAYY